MHGSPSAPARKLTLATRLGYGVGDMAGSATFTIYGFFMNAFLLDVAGMRPALVGLIFLVSQIWDAVIDPVIGALTDRTRSRFGRKRAWLLWGAVPFGLAYILHWWVPPVEGWTQFGYYLLMAMLYKGTLSAVGIPYVALAADIGNNHQERLLLNTYRFVLNISASLLAIVLHPVLVELAGDSVRSGYLISAGFFGVFGVLSLLACFASTYENRPHPISTPINLLRDLKTVFTSRAFLIATLVFLISGLAIFSVQSNLLLYFRYWIRLEEQFTPVILAYQVTVIVSMGLWARVAKHADKRWIYLTAALLWAGGLSCLFVMPRDVWLPYLPVAVVIGIGQAAAAYLVPWSMLPEVVDEDELAGGERREGLFYGMYVLLQQVGLSLGLAASGFVLETAGYITPQPGQTVVQPDPVLTAIKVLNSLAPAALLLVSIPLALAYPITPARFAEIRRKLDARRNP